MGMASRFRMLASPGQAELRGCPFATNASGSFMLRFVLLILGLFSLGASLDLNWARAQIM